MSRMGVSSDGTQSRNRIVAFVDILGASQAALSGHTTALVGDIFRLGRTMRWTHRVHRRRADGSSVQEYKPGVAQFSDCLLLWSDPLDGLSPPEFVDAAGSFLWNLCAEMGRLLLAGIPFRAGVSEGPVVILPELNIYAGRPIVEAAKLESCQDWLGAAMLFADRPDRLIKSPNEIFVAGDRSMFDHFVVSDVQVPLKGNAPDHPSGNTVVALNWALSAQEAPGPSFLDLKTKLEELQSIAGDSAQEKYKLAMEFLAVVERRSVSAST
jgi:hypothetical protein